MFMGDHGRPSVRGAALTMLCTLAQALQPVPAAGQVRAFPYVEGFDSSAALPSGWSSTRARHPLENDAAVSTSTPRSAPHCVLITNATIAQALISPLFVFPPRNGADLSFHTRRSASFGAAVLLELSADSGRTFRTAAVAVAIRRVELRPLRPWRSIVCRPLRAPSFCGGGFGPIRPGARGPSGWMMLRSPPGPSSMSGSSRCGSPADPLRRR